MISNFFSRFGIGLLKLIIVLSFSYYLFRLEMGFPIRKFIYDFSVWYVIYFIFMVLTRRSLFSLCLSVGVLWMFFLASNKKLSLMSSYIIKDDVVFLFNNPLFVLNFASGGMLLGVVFLIFGGWLLYRNEFKCDLILDMKRLVVLVMASFVALWMPLQDEYVYHEDRPAGTRALLQFFASYRSDFGLSIPEAVSDNMYSCCDKAQSHHLLLTSQRGDEQKNIIFVLMESTFDLGRLGHPGYSSVFSDLPYFPLQTYVVGGGTWVEEFAVLHGVSPPMYGPNFKAINTLGMGRLSGRIAPALINAGYKTKTFSISDKAFYGGEAMHKSLGVNEYFASDSRTDYGDKSLGHADADILKDVLHNLKNEVVPSFVFVTTGLNHSPHEKEYKNNTHIRLKITEKKANILQEYMEREVVFLGVMKDFLQGLRGLKRDSVVIFFGDHIPAAVNENFTDGEFDGGDKYKTIGILYSTAIGDFVNLRQVTGCHPKMVEVSDLDAIGLRLAGYNSLYINEKISNIKNTCVSSLNSSLHQMNRSNH